TSRAPLHLRAERELRLEPLGDSAAAELFIARPQPVRAVFSPSHADRVAIGSLVARLDGLPLALELAAARVKLLSPAQILERLEKRMPVLTTGASDAPSRQRTLRATVEWSYQQLSEHERAVLQTVATFARYFALDTIEDVVQRAERGVDPADVLDLLDG